MKRPDLKTIPSYILEKVKMTLRKEWGKNDFNNEWNDRIEAMTKIEIMDKYFESFADNINSFEICRFVKSYFHIDLDTMPGLSEDLGEKDFSPKEGTTSMTLAKSLLDSQLDQYGKDVTGEEIRKMINNLFGVNLDAIVSLEGTGISLYSKGQWIIRDDQDLFVVWTGTGDVDAKVIPTNYFTEQTGLKRLPADLEHALSSLGYSCDEKAGGYYFKNPTGKAVEDAFKGKTIGAILKVIQDSYPAL